MSCYTVVRLTPSKTMLLLMTGCKVLVIIINRYCWVSTEEAFGDVVRQLKLVIIYYYTTLEYNVTLIFVLVLRCKYYTNTINSNNTSIKVVPAVLNQ